MANFPRSGAKSLVFKEPLPSPDAAGWEALYKLIASAMEGAIIDTGERIATTKSR